MKGEKKKGKQKGIEGKINKEKKNKTRQGDKMKENRDNEKTTTLL